MVYTVDNEFIVGDSILVAPVMDVDCQFRDVILPLGKWMGCWTGHEYEGTLKNFPAPCPGIPIFVRTSNHRLFNLLQSRIREIQRGTMRSDITSATYQPGINRSLDVTG